MKREYGNRTQRFKYYQGFVIKGPRKQKKNDEKDSAKEYLRKWSTTTRVYWSWRWSLWIWAARMECENVPIFPCWNCREALSRFFGSRQVLVALSVVKWILFVPWMIPVTVVYLSVSVRVLPLGKRTRLVILTRSPFAKVMFWRSTSIAISSWRRKAATWIRILFSWEMRLSSDEVFIK